MLAEVFVDLDAGGDLLLAPSAGEECFAALALVADSGFIASGVGIGGLPPGVDGFGVVGGDVKGHGVLLQGWGVDAISVGNGIGGVYTQFDHAGAIALSCC